MDNDKLENWKKSALNGKIISFYPKDLLALIALAERSLSSVGAVGVGQQKPVAWAAESMTGGAVRMLTKISLLESEVDRYVNRQDMAAIGCDRVKVPLYAAAQAPAPQQEPLVKASAVPEGVVTGLRKVYEWMTKLPVPTDGIIPQLKRLKGVIHILEESAPQTEEAPALPDWLKLEGDTITIHGIRYATELFANLANFADALPIGEQFSIVNREKDGAITICRTAPTSHVQLSIDTPEFRGLMLAASTAWPTQVKQIKALVAHIDAWKDACCARARAEDREQVNEEIAGAVWRDDLQAAMTQDPRKD